MIVRCATSNPGKLREFRLAGAATADLSIEPLANLAAIEPPEESGDTFEANAAEKARYYAAHTTDWLFAEDSGLEVHALGGAPGVYSARFSGPDADDRSNNSLLLERLNGTQDRRAQFVCVIALVRAGKLVRTFRGEVQGEIANEPRGPNGFGYDPLFYYPPFGCTFGEVDADAKMRVSHRARALRALFDFLIAENARR